MERFSYICKGCGKPINHQKEGLEDTVILYLLQRGRVLEYLKGYYNGYGGIHQDSWVIYPEIIKQLHSTKDKSNGVAAFHLECDLPYFPVERSDYDPDKGLGIPKFIMILNKIYHQFNSNVDYNKLKRDQEFEDQVYDTVYKGIDGLLEKTDKILNLLSYN